MNAGLGQLSGPYQITSSRTISLAIGSKKACFLTGSNISQSNDAGGCAVYLDLNLWYIRANSDASVNGVSSCSAYCFD